MNRTDALLTALTDLLDWAAFMGGFDARAWRDARKALRSADPDRLRSALSGLLEWEAIQGGYDSPVWDRARDARDA